MSWPYCIRLQTRERFFYKKYLLLIGEIEQNPRHRWPKFPYAVCSTACNTKYIACDDCDQWMHKSCIGLPTAEFSALCSSEERWSCPNCLKPNNSSTVYTVPGADIDPPAQTSHLKESQIFPMPQDTAVQTLTMWAATWQNQQSECASSEDSDQPGHLRSLIRVCCPHEESLGP